MKTNPCLVYMDGIPFKGNIILYDKYETDEKAHERFRVFSTLKSMKNRIYPITMDKIDSYRIHQDRTYVDKDLYGWFIYPGYIYINDIDNGDIMTYVNLFEEDGYDVEELTTPIIGKNGKVKLYDGVMNRNEEFMIRNYKLFQNPYTIVILPNIIRQLNKKIQPDLFDYLKMVIHPWWNVYLLYYGPMKTNVRPKVVCLARDRMFSKDDDHIAGIAITRYKMPDDQMVVWLNQTSDRDLIKMKREKSSIERINKEGIAGGWPRKK